jgi:hypothetical protein
MQDPTPIIKDLVDQLEHAHDILSELDFSGCEERRPETDEAIERADVLARANAYLTARHNADLFEQEPAA